jgi:hypothetical protein
MTQSISSQRSIPEISRYEDTAEDGRRISLVHVEHVYPKASATSYEHHESLRDLCKNISNQRNPKGASEKEISPSSATSPQKS